MSPKGPRRLAELLQTGDIARLTDKAAQRRELTETTRAALPAEQAEHLISASVDDDGVLVLTMDSGAWAAKLRYERRMLDGRPIRVKVAPGPGSSPS